VINQHQTQIASSFFFKSEKYKLFRTAHQPTRPKLDSIMDFPFRDEDFCVFGRKICHQIGNWLVCYDPDVLLSSKSIHTLQAGNFHIFTHLHSFTVIYIP
jgi:hypothetical protein